MNDVLSNLHQLPAIPAVVQKLMNSFDNAAMDVDALARLISQDQGLSARVLRVANSAFYGLPRQVGSIPEAVVVLGFNTVRSLVVAAGFMQAFFPYRYGLFDRRVFWRLSFRVGEYARSLSKSFHVNPEMAFSAGLFYDIGQLALDICMHDQFAAVLEAARCSGRGLIETEQSVFGFDHAMIGAEVAKRWNFPQEIEAAIRYNHFPEAAQFEPLTSLVHVAGLFAVNADSLGEDKMLADRVKNLLGLEWHEVGALLPDPAQLDAMANLLMA